MQKKLSCKCLSAAFPQSALHSLSCGTQHQSSRTELSTLQRKHSSGLHIPLLHRDGSLTVVMLAKDGQTIWLSNSDKTLLGKWVQMRFILVFFGGSQSGQIGTVFQDMTEVVSPTAEALSSQISSRCSTEALDLLKARHCESFLNYRYICFVFSSLILRNCVWTASD